MIVGSLDNDAGHQHQPSPTALVPVPTRDDDAPPPATSTTPPVAVTTEPPSITPQDQLPSELLLAAQGKAPPPKRAAYEYSHAQLKGAALCALQEHGTLGGAAKAIGINRRTLYVWREEDEELRLAVKDIEEYCTDLIEERMWKQAQAGDTIAAIFYLKGKRPKRWHDKARLEVSGPGGGPVPVQVAPGEAAELRETARQLREAKGSTEASE